MERLSSLFGLLGEEDERFGQGRVDLGTPVVRFEDEELTFHRVSVPSLRRRKEGKEVRTSDTEARVRWIWRERSLSSPSPSPGSGSRSGWGRGWSTARTGTGMGGEPSTTKRAFLCSRFFSLSFPLSFFDFSFFFFPPDLGTSAPRTSCCCCCCGAVPCTTCSPPPTLERPSSS